jgi:hypothetical protein
MKNDVPGIIETDEMEVVLADIESCSCRYRCRSSSLDLSLGGSWIMLLLATAPKISGCVSEHGRSIPLAVIPASIIKPENTKFQCFISPACRQPKVWLLFTSLDRHQ